MKRATESPDMLDEYDFSRGVRGKYAERFAKGTVVNAIRQSSLKRKRDERE